MGVCTNEDKRKQEAKKDKRRVAVGCSLRLLSLPGRERGDTHTHTLRQRHKGMDKEEEVVEVTVSFVWRQRPACFGGGRERERDP